MYIKYSIITAFKNIVHYENRELETLKGIAAKAVVLFYFTLGSGSTTTLI